MVDNKKTKKQLIAELEELRKQVTGLKNKSAEKSNFETARSGATEMALKDSDSKYRTVIENAFIGILVIQNGQRVFYNSRIPAMLGYTNEEYGNIEYISTVYPDDRAFVVDRIKKKLAGNNIDTDPIEIRVLNKSGKVKWIETYSAPIQWENKPALQVFVSDITERKKAEETLKISQNRFQSLVTYTTDSVFCYEYDPPIPTELPIKEQIPLFYNGILVECNDVCAKTYGAERAEEVIGRSLIENFATPPGGLDDFFRKFIEDGYRMLDEEGKEILEDGTERYYLNRGHGVVDDGKLIRVWGTFRDVTDHKRAEMALLEREEGYRAIAEDTPVLICRFLPDSKITYVNEAYCKYFAKSSEELIGQTFLTLIPEADRETIMAHISSLTVDTPTQSLEHRVMAPGGEIRWQRWTNRALFDADGKTIAYQSIGEDITERKRTENLIRIQRDLGISLGKSVDFREMLRLSLRAGFEASEMDCGGIYIVDPITGALDLLYHEGLPEDFVAAVGHYEADSPNALVVMAGDPAYTSHKELGPPLKKAEAEEQLKALAVVPIKHANQVVGGLNVGSHTYEEVPQFARYVLEAIASQIGDAIANRQAQGALRKNEALLNATQRLMKVGGWEWDVRSQTMFWTEETYRIHGFNPGGIKPGSKEHIEHSLECYDPDDRPVILNAFEECIRQGKAYDIEVPFTTVQGQRKWIRTTAKAEKENGEIVKVIGNIMDITQRKRAEEALQSSEERFRDMAEMLPETIFEADKEMNLTFANKKAFDLFGYTKEDFEKGLNGLELLVPDDRDRAKANIARRLKGEKLGTIEYRAMKKDGSIYPILFHANARIKEGTLVGFRGIIVDITNRKQAEEKLRESEEKFRSITERIYDVIISATLNGEISYVSPSIRQAFGYKPEELVGKNVKGLVPEAKTSQVIEALQLTAAGEDVEGHQFEFLRKDGTYATIELNAVPIYKNDEIIGGQAIIRDITETKRLQELESRAERLEMAGTIAGQVAHDFNNLLSPIVAYPEFIHEELPHDHMAHPYLDAIESAAKKIADINQDLLTMGRRGHYNQEILDINRVVLQTTQEIESRTKTVTCNVELCKNLMNIKGGAAQIHRMLTNLLVNARDAMGDMGQITIKTENYYADDTSIAFGRVPKGEYVKLSISDTGCGIPDNIIQKIFDPFFSTKTTDKKRGSGLGLSVVDAVMKDHSGYLDINSKIGHGTTFYLYFPVTREGADEEESGQIAKGNETVLIVDDDEIQCDVSESLLKNLGYNVNSVKSGEKAVEFLRKNPQDIIILDMVMPGGIDGTATYQQILDINPHQKAIILSGFSESDRVLEAQKLGAGIFVKKPVTKKTIAAAVRKELDKVPAC